MIISYFLRGLVARRSSNAGALAGVALVVFLLASVLMLANGIRRVMGNTGRPDHAIVLSRGALAEVYSFIPAESARAVLGDPAVESGVAEFLTLLSVTKPGGEGFVNVQLRGVADGVMRFRPGVKVVEGRPMRFGASEVMIGKKVRGRFPDFELGRTVLLAHNRPMQVVGVFESDESMMESEVWADAAQLAEAFNRPGEFSSISLKLKSPDRFDAFKASLEGDRRFGLEAHRERDFFEAQSQGSAGFVQGLGMLMAVFFSFAAMIGAMNTMYSSVDARTRDIGVLRALGFSRFGILAGVLLESIVLCAAGGALGALAALAMRGVSFSTLNLVSWSEITFAFIPTPGIVLGSVAAAAFMGLAGGLLPAWRASKVPPLAALRE